MTDSEHLIAASLTHSNGHYQSLGAQTKFRNKNPTILNKCDELQDLILADASKSKGSALGQLAKAFVSLEQLKLRVRMKPAPKPVDVQPRGKAKPPRSSFTESAGTIVASVPVVTKPETPQA